MIIKAIKEKKGGEITIINLNDIQNSPCSFFVICTANSTTQISAIANNIEKILKEEMNIELWKDEGRKSNWRLLDYSNIVVHVFKKEFREKYKLEELWADGLIQKVK